MSCCSRGHLRRENSANCSTGGGEGTAGPRPVWWWLARWVWGPLSWRCNQIICFYGAIWLRIFVRLTCLTHPCPQTPPPHPCQLTPDPSPLHIYTFSPVEVYDLATFLFQQHVWDWPALHVLSGSRLFMLHPGAHFPACDRNTPALDSITFPGP